MTAMRIHGPNEPVYTIGVVARLLGISPQTLRLFEREGLIDPSRTQSNIRLYSQSELVLLQKICTLIKDDGLNLAGVRTVLRVERRYERIIETLRVEAGLPEETVEQTAQGGRDAGRIPEDAGPPSARRAGGTSEPEDGPSGPGGAAAGRRGRPSPSSGTRSGSKPGGAEGWAGLGAMLALLLCNWWN